MIRPSPSFIRKALAGAALCAVAGGITAAPAPAQARVFIGFGFGFPYYYGPAYVPPPYWYPPAYYAPPPVYYRPPVSYTPAAPAPAGQSCYAGPYVCPMDRPVAAGGTCYCLGNSGRRVPGRAS